MDVLDKNFWRRWLVNDARILFFLILFSYLILGITVLGFNRSPLQALVTTISTCLFEFLIRGFLKKKWEFPISALITSMSLSLLLNYSHNYYVLFIPVFFAIGSKYLFTFNGRHVFNPAQIAVTLSLLVGGGLVTSAPAYQWNGIENLWVFMVLLGLIIFHPKVQRQWLVASFLLTYTIQTFLRAMIMRHHLPFETLFLGTLTSPSFILFTFFMITDPMTSPSSKKDQIRVGMIVATLDLLYHLKQSYFTFFFAGSTFQAYRLISQHLKAILHERNVVHYFDRKFIRSNYYKQLFALIFLFFIFVNAYNIFIKPKLEIGSLDFKLSVVPEAETGIKAHYGGVLDRVDPNVKHMAKWLLSVGDSIAIDDFDQDGIPDLFFTFPLKMDGERGALYRGMKHFKYERVHFSNDVEEKLKNVENYGLPSYAQFVDFDNDGDSDLYIGKAFGQPMLLKNLLKEKGIANFIDVTENSGLAVYTNSLASTFFDINNDGLLDVVIAQVWPSHLPDYDQKERLNLFKLPKPEYEGDQRPFNFMHVSWHMANNGGQNLIFLQDINNKFVQQNSSAWGFNDTYWSLALGTVDFNKDGFIDLYVANDFGPDELYYNRGGKYFEKIKGKIFGDISNDTYKGMNVSIADVDKNNYLDVYVSNVHHEMQAEGSLLWLFFPSLKGGTVIQEAATQTGLLNEERFGWGASFGDLNNDSNIDLVQTNGMVDDSIDHQYDRCPDFWYVNEKIARSSPEVHRHIQNWGDIRGHCIYGQEKIRVYQNRGGNDLRNRFIDVADLLGITDLRNSRGVAMSDLDRNGTLDFIVTNQFHSPVIYKNTITKSNKWVELSLLSKSKKCNAMALGSRVVVSYELNGKRESQIQELHAPTGFSAQNDRIVHFGLGETTGPVEIEINWCLKEIRKYKVENLNQRMDLIYE